MLIHLFLQIWLALLSPPQPPFGGITGNPERIEPPDITTWKNVDPTSQMGWANQANRLIDPSGNPHP